MAHVTLAYLRDVEDKEAVSHLSQTLSHINQRDNQAGLRPEYEWPMIQLHFFPHMEVYDPLDFKWTF